MKGVSSNPPPRENAVQAGAPRAQLRKPEARAYSRVAEDTDQSVARGNDMRSPRGGG